MQENRNIDFELARQQYFPVIKAKKNTLCGNNMFPLEYDWQ